MKRHALALCLAAIFAVQALVAAQTAPDENSLRLAHQTVLSTLTSGNPSVLGAVVHGNGVGFFRDSQMIVQLRADYGPQEAIPAVLADLGRFTVATYDTVYRVVGTTGIVCMAMKYQPKKGEKALPRYVRSTWIYAQLDGAWRLVSWHSSDIPLKK